MLLFSLPPYFLCFVDFFSSLYCKFYEDLTFSVKTNQSSGTSLKVNEVIMLVPPGKLAFYTVPKCLFFLSMNSSALKDV